LRREQELTILGSLAIGYKSPCRALKVCLLTNFGLDYAADGDNNLSPATRSTTIARTAVDLL
jgi:hypothetical protein